MRGPLNCLSLAPYLDLPLAHDLVHNLIVVLVDLGLVIALLIAQDPQGLRTLQLNLKLLVTDGRNKGSESLKAVRLPGFPARVGLGCARQR